MVIDIDKQIYSSRVYKGAEGNIRAKKGFKKNRFFLSVLIKYYLPYLP